MSWLAERMYGWTHGRMDGQTDEWTESRTQSRENQVAERGCTIPPFVLDLTGDQGPVLSGPIISLLCDLGEPCNLSEHSSARCERRAEMPQSPNSPWAPTFPAFLGRKICTGAGEQR